jgi:hypothetical protein
MVLQEEPDIQSWYAVRWSSMLDGEQFVCLH